MNSSAPGLAQPPRPCRPQRRRRRPRHSRRHGRGRCVLGRGDHMVHPAPRRAPLHHHLPALGARPRMAARRLDRQRLPQPGGLPRRLRPHLRPRRDGDAGHPRARLPARLAARRPARAAGRLAHHPRAAAVLDLDPGAHRGLAGAAAEIRPGEPVADLARPEQRQLRTDVHPHRPDHRHDAHPATVHLPADLQRDAHHRRLADARRRLAGRPPGARLRQRLPAAGAARRRRRRAADLHPLPRLLHYPRADRRCGRPADQQFHRELHQLRAELADGGLAQLHPAGGTLVLSALLGRLLGGTRVKIV